MRHKTKKGEFFLIDGLLSIVILIIGFLILSSNHQSQENEISLSIIAESTMDFFSSVRVDELCDGCRCSVSVLSDYCSRDFIKNKNQTLLDSMGEQYYLNNKARAGELFRNITTGKNMIREDIFGFELKINGDSIYVHEKKAGSMENSKEMISSKKIIFSYYEYPETGQVVFWGPYLAEVDIWQE